MNPPVRHLFVGAAVALFFALTSVALAEEAPAAPTAPTATQEKPVPAAVVETPPASAAAPAEPASTVLRRLDANPTTDVAPVEQKTPSGAADAKSAKQPKRTSRSHTGDDRVSVMGGTHVLAGEKLEGDAVGVMADVTIDGEISGDAVAVMGDNFINGTVNGSAVAVMGDIHLGPNAKVAGDLVCVGGNVIREAGAQVGGKVVKKSGAGHLHVSPAFDSWWNNGLKLGRPLAIGPGLHWQLILLAFTIAFYALLALVFPGGIRRCGDALVQRPGAVIGTSILTMFGLPVLFVLLIVTIIGIPVALLLLPAGVMLGTMFGQAALCGLVGRAVSNDRLHPALAVLVGAVPFVLFALVPLAGLMLWGLASLLGLGCVLIALFGAEKRVAPPPPAIPPMAAPAAAPMAEGAASPPVATTAVAAFVAQPAPEAPAASAASQPRAGFWIRAGALAIDGILICVIFAPLGAGPGVLPLLAIYGAIMWKLKGTTIGGIVCGLQIVRLDERPLDWPTVVVRALGSFLSLIVAGLGFVWVAFDREKQSWHDKIAGTTVVHTAKRTSLV